MREKTPANLLALGVPKKKEERYYGKLQQICGHPVVTAHQICFQRDPDDLQDRKECIVPKKKEKRVTKKNSANLQAPGGNGPSKFVSGVTSTTHEIGRNGL